MRSPAAAGPTRTQASCHEPPARARLMFSQAMPSRVRAAASEPASTGRNPMDSTTSRTVCLAARSSPATKPSAAIPETDGSACVEANAVLNALTTLLPGSWAWSSSASEVAAPAGSGVGRLETSTTTLPAAESPISRATAPRALAGTARMTRSAVVDCLGVRSRGASLETAGGLGCVLWIGGGEGHVVAGAHKRTCPVPCRRCRPR